MRHHNWLKVVRMIHRKMTEPISIRGTLNKADLLPIARYTVWKRSMLLKVMFGVGILFLLVGVSNLLIGQGANAIPPLFLGLFWTGYVVFSPQISIRRQFKKRAAIAEEASYDFDESQFRIARPSVQVSMPWSTIHSAVEMQDLFAIFTTKTCFYSIPKRFFSADELRSFRDLLELALRKSGKKFVLRGSTGRSPAR
jgi:hypothetical protein